MQSDNTQAVLLIPADLGLVGNYDLPIQLDRIAAKGALHAGDVYLRAALNEMAQIVYLCKSLEENHLELLRQTKAQYYHLNQRKMELELLEKRGPIFKLFKLIAIKHAKRAFREDAQGLWISTMTTSERLKRHLISTPLANVAPVESEAVRRDQRVSGLAIPLPPSAEMNAPDVKEALAAVQQVASILSSSGNPFADTSSSSRDGQSSTASSLFDSEPLSSARSSISTSLTSPGSASSFSWLNVNVNCNIVNNVDSNAPGLTINNGSENSGSELVLSSEGTGPLDDPAGIAPSRCQ